MTEEYSSSDTSWPALQLVGCSTSTSLDKEDRDIFKPLAERGEASPGEHVDVRAAAYNVLGSGLADIRTSGCTELDWCVIRGGPPERRYPRQITLNNKLKFPRQLPKTKHHLAKKPPKT